MLDFIANLFSHRDLTRMGHGQRVQDQNLGLGWLYYALARTLRPATVVVIGSFRGFVPLVFAKALDDNLEKGQVVFIDPSFVDDFWKNPDQVRGYFAGFGLSNIRHFLMTTQEFVQSDAYRQLVPVGIVFVDGYHSEEQARFDFEAFQDRLTPDGIVLFHDSARPHKSKIYGVDKTYEYRVREFVDTLKKDPRLQVFDIPCFSGVTLVRRT
jgi:predicted O-methyltransferase YrrM